MKKLTLTNGVEIVAYCGDGFDGGSGFYCRSPDPRQRQGEVVVPQRDLPAVISLVEWYIATEMESREREGAIYIGCFDKQKKLPYNELSHPFQAKFFLGYLKAPINRS